MKKIVNITLLLWLVNYGFMQCQKPGAIEEQTVFENLPSCGICDTTANSSTREYCKLTLSDTFIIRNVTGELLSAGPVTPTWKKIHTDFSVWNYPVDPKRFPVWKDYRSSLIMCNLPKALAALPGIRKVKFDCRFNFMPPPSPGFALPDLAGYPVELLRIELLD